MFCVVCAFLFAMYADCRRFDVCLCVFYLGIVLFYDAFIRIACLASWTLCYVSIVGTNVCERTSV